jgi:predicted CXXCH cytochrome family protein
MYQRLFLGILAIIFLAAKFGASPVWASDPAQQGSDNESCLVCHERPNLTYEFPLGETWSLFVDQEAYESSVHGQEEMLCTDCHSGVSQYPHEPLAVNSIRFYQLDQYQSCQECHAEVYEQTLDSVHARELAGGNWNAPVCTDCHGAHDTTPANEPRTKIPETCSKCHSGIFNEYLESIHGEALVDENNIDVPTCIDCHGVHNQEDPRTAAFRLNSPELCGTCHADEALMSKYDISTNVFQTYVADFHGTTVTLFERQSPDLPTNKAVCYDCHGVHNMKRADDPDSQVFRENLLQTCQKCHPDATENFPTTWLRHYEPDRERFPLVYFVDLFYKILIPAVVGFMGIYVVMDSGSRLIYRFSSKRDVSEAAGERIEEKKEAANTGEGPTSGPNAVKDEPGIKTEKPKDDTDPGTQGD